MIYICIPTHNEQQTVGVVLWKLRQVFQDFPRDYQLLVADDASTDKTADVLEPYTRVLPLTVIHCERKQGYAASMEMLLREAVRRSEYPKRDVIVTLQADFSEEPDDLVPLLKRMEAGADVAVGNKISKSKDTRMRRLSRKLAGFFLRGAKWPDGVETPFDGYRAYRLHAIKRAIEEGGGKRVLHFDSWAGHAQLLRAVLPHARRVDVVDVVERADRLQRPRREQPFAAAFQVRALVGGKEPQGLTGVEELDRIAATASRSRAQSRITQQSSRPASGNGKREESRRPGSGDGRTRQRESAPRGEAPRRGEAERGRERPRARPAQAAGEDPTRRQGRPARGATAAATEEQIQQRRKRGPKPQTTEAQTAQAPLDVATGEPKAKKKRRRRRKKSAEPNVITGTAPETAPAGAPAGLPVVEADATAPDSVMTMEADAEGGAEAAAAGDATGAPERKRRRRGGRRGGRGRRKGRAEGAAAEGGALEGAAVEGTTAEGSFGEVAAAETTVNERAVSQRAGGMIAEEGSATGGVSDGGNSPPAAPVESAPMGSDND